MRRNFLWNADEEAKGGKCLVNWRRICAPKAAGGPGIKDLTAFSRALRLRWPWFEWDNHDRPWKGTTTSCDSSDLQLFKSCTKISIGDGSRAMFWTDRWMEGVAPGEVAPQLFSLAHHKQTTMADALRDGKWMRGLQRLNSAEMLRSFVLLWHQVQQVQLSNTTDDISRTLSANGL